MRRAILEAGARRPRRGTEAGARAARRRPSTEPPLARTSAVDREQVEPPDERRPAPLVLGVGGRLRRVRGRPADRHRGHAAVGSHELARLLGHQPQHLLERVVRRRGPARRPRGRSTAGATARSGGVRAGRPAEPPRNPRWTISNVDRPSRKKSPAARAIALDLRRVRGVGERRQQAPPGGRRPGRARSAAGSPPRARARTRRGARSRSVRSR